jgi:hypothetical protein
VLTCLIVFRLQFLLLFTLVISGCRTTADTPPPSREKFDECSGVVAFKTTEQWGENAAVRVYDENAAIWYMAEFNRPEFNAIRHMGPNPISPLTFIRGSYTPEFRCAGTSPNWFRVIAVEADRDPVLKYIRRSDRMFEWKPWDQYFLRRYIRFDRQANPLYLRRGGGEQISPADNIEHFYAAKLEGDWLQLDWKERAFIAGRNAVEQKTGWIKWRDPETGRVIAFPHQ